MADSFLRVETAESCIVLAILLMPLNALSRLPLFTWASTTLENKALTALGPRSFVSGGLDVILTCAVANDPKESCTTTHSVSVLFVPEPAGMIAVFSGLLDEGPQTLQSLPVPLLSAPKAYLRGKASFSAIHPVAAIENDILQLLNMQVCEYRVRCMRDSWSKRKREQEAILGFVHSQQALKIYLYILIIVFSAVEEVLKKMKITRIKMRWILRIVQQTSISRLQFCIKRKCDAGSIVYFTQNHMATA